MGLTYREIEDKILPLYEEDPNHPEDFFFEYEEEMKSLGVIEYPLDKRNDDSWEIVVYFKDHDVYMKFVGAYDSDEGSDWSYTVPFEVTPQQKMITVYAKVK